MRLFANQFWPMWLFSNQFGPCPTYFLSANFGLSHWIIFKRELFGHRNILRTKVAEKCIHNWPNIYSTKVQSAHLAGSSYPAPLTQALYKSDNHMTGGSTHILHTVAERGSGAKLGFLGKPGFGENAMSFAVIMSNCPCL